MPAFSKLKFVNQDIKHLVFGYIRIIEKLLSLNIVPDGITNLCILYYFESEEFDIHSSFLSVSSSNEHKKNDIVTHDEYTDNYNMVYGINKIDANATPDAIYKWSLKLTKRHVGNFYVGIGILSETEKLYEWCFQKLDECTMFYGWDVDYLQLRSHDGDHEEYGIECESGDVVTMELNIKEKTLKYYRNNVDMGIANFKDIDFSVTYHFAIAINHVGLQIQILDDT